MSVTMQTLMELERARLDEIQNPVSPTRSLGESFERKWALKTWDALFNSGFQMCPVGSYILVKDIPQEEGISAGGIFLPAARTDQELTRAVVIATPARGIPVVAKGNGKIRGYRDPVVGKGDIVAYERFKGIEVATCGVTHVLIEESDIVLTFEKESLNGNKEMS